MAKDWGVVLAADTALAMGEGFEADAVLVGMVVSASGTGLVVGEVWGAGGVWVVGKMSGRELARAEAMRGNQAVAERALMWVLPWVPVGVGPKVLLLAICSVSAKDFFDSQMIHQVRRNHSMTLRRVIGRRPVQQQERESRVWARTP